MSDGDYRFMDIVWKNEPVSSMDLVRICADALGWKKSTVFTMIKRMAEKGCLVNENAVVTACVDREKVQKIYSERLVKENFDGSLPGFLDVFLKDRTLSMSEAEELTALIRAHRE